MLSDTWKLIAIAICLVLFTADTVLKPQDKPNRMVFFQLHRGGSPMMIGVMRDDLIKLPGRGAHRIHDALMRGETLTVWQYELRKIDNGSYQEVPERQIELGAADAPLVTFGARVRLPDD